MKDTYISTALTAGVNTAWLEAQTGVRYETLRRHYGKWLRTEGTDQLKKMARLAPSWPPARCRIYKMMKLMGKMNARRGT